MAHHGDVPFAAPIGYPELPSYRHGAAGGPTRTQPFPSKIQPGRCTTKSAGAKPVLEWRFRRDSDMVTPEGNDRFNRQNRSFQPV